MKKGLQLGTQSVAFDKPVHIMSSASVVGPKEGEGPLKDTFDKTVEDATFGKDSWEEGESEMLKETILLALRKVSADIETEVDGERTHLRIGIAFLRAAGIEQFAQLCVFPELGVNLVV